MKKTLIKLNTYAVFTTAPNMFRANMFHLSTLPKNKFAICLFTSVVNFKTCFIPGSIISVVLQNRLTIA